MTDDEIAKLKGFTRWVISNAVFDGGDLAGDEVQDKAEALGLIIPEAYDPEKHKGVSENFDPEEGDTIYLYADFLKE